LRFALYFKWKSKRKKLVVRSIREFKALSKEDEDRFFRRIP